MKTIKYAVALLVGFSFQIVFANTACKTSDLRNARVGFRCTTSKGFDFELIHRDQTKNEWWLDVKSNLVWGDKHSRSYMQPVARRLCAEEKAGLPQRDDFEDAEVHGFREVSRDMNSGWYWSSTPYPGNSDFAIFYNALDGSLGYEVFDRDLEVRCVSN